MAIVWIGEFEQRDEPTAAELFLPVDAVYQAFRQARASGQPEPNLLRVNMTQEEATAMQVLMDTRFPRTLITAEEMEADILASLEG